MTTKTTPEKGKRENKLPTLAETINSQEFLKQLKIALGPNVDAARYARGVLTSIVTAPDHTKSLLLKADRNSICRSILTAAQLRLDIDARQHASLIPFKNSKKGTIEAQVIPGYKGYIAKAREASNVADVYAKLAYKGDHFEIIEGTSPRIDHRPDIRNEYYGKAEFAEFAYSVIRYTNGAIDFEVMTREEALEIKNSLRYESPIWVNHFGEMFKKSVIRRHAKRWQLPIVDEITTIDDTVAGGHLISYSPIEGAVIEGKAETTMENKNPQENDDESKKIWKDISDLLIKHKKTDEEFYKFLAGMYPGTKYGDLSLDEKRSLLDTLKKEFRDV